MNLKSVSVSNFLSFGDCQSYSVQPGTILIVGNNLDEGGSNGCGKSSFVDAISWALFGRTTRGLKGDDVINRYIKKNCCVELSLEFRGKKYKISRYRKHKEFGDRLLLDIDGEKIECGTLAMTEERILKEFNLDYDLFTCTVLFAQGGNFNFVDAGNKAQKEILSKIMRISYEIYQKRAKERQKDLESEVQAGERELAILNSHIIEDLDAHFADQEAAWEKERVQRLKSLNERLRSEQEHFDSIEIISSVEELKEKKRRYEEKRAEIWGKYESIDSRISELKFEIRELEGKKIRKEDSNCPTCGQPWPNNKKFQDSEVVNSEIDSKVAIIDGKIKELVALKEKAKAMLSKTDSLIANIQSEIRIIEERINLKKHLASSIASIKREIEGAQNAENPVKDLKNKEKEKQKKIASKIVEIQKKVALAKEEIPMVAFWVEAFGDSGIKSFVFDLICSTLTAKANKYLSVLTSGTVAITFDTQKKLKSGQTREKFDCSIITDGQVIPYAAYSGGEKRRISLAVDMSLSEIMSEYYDSDFNFVIFDESTNYLDDQGKRHFFTLVRELGKTKAVYVVDHDASLKGLFDDILLIEKKGGISRIVA
jgi:DNA repair exonuclease SbcCD ATPase subunit